MEQIIEGLTTLVQNPDTEESVLIKGLMKINAQGEAYAVGDDMVGKAMTGGDLSKNTKEFVMNSKEKKVKNKRFLAKNGDHAVIIAFLILADPKCEDFDFKINRNEYRASRRLNRDRDIDAKYKNRIIKIS